MKAAIGHKIQQGPWGGGNNFVRALRDFLESNGHRVVFDLGEDDIDVVLVIDPRARNPAVSFTPGAVLRYLAFRNSRAVVVHRINECDERKNTRGMNARLRRANYCADHTVFIASWLRSLPVFRATADRSEGVILNGGDVQLFNSKGYRRWCGDGPLRLVTHHWGGNWMKGFDVYSQLDTMLGDPGWRDRISFTYVGNLPSGFRFRHARYVAPLHGQDLADELRRHHVYVTASINEPAGMHHIEGAMCGLPLLYRNSGALPEYCDGFGIMFDDDCIEPALERMLAEYPKYVARMNEYPHTADRMCTGYINLFERLLESRDRIVAKRRLWRNPYLALRNQLAI